MSEDDTDASSEPSATTGNGVSGRTLTNGTKIKGTRLRNILVRVKRGASNKSHARRVTYADVAQVPVKKEEHHILK